MIIQKLNLNEHKPIKIYHDCKNYNHSFFPTMDNNKDLKEPFIDDYPKNSETIASTGSDTEHVTDLNASKNEANSLKRIHRSTKLLKLILNV